MEKEVYIYLNSSEDSTIEQFKDCYSKDFVVRAALMPDAHKGYVAPIGSVIETKGQIVPSWVGYDIGCGVLAVKIVSSNFSLYERIKDFKEVIFSKVLTEVPMGKGRYNKYEKIKNLYIFDYEKIISNYKNVNLYDKADLNQFLSNFAVQNIGSLGSGNHFIELGFLEETKEIVVVIHSGSRKVGHNFAKKYMKLAMKNELNKKRTNGLSDIKEFFDEGRNFEKTYVFDIKEELGMKYFYGMNFCSAFAKLNRFVLFKEVLRVIEDICDSDLDYEILGESVHNFAEVNGDLIVHRKGATKAEKGKVGIIPGNIKDGTFIVEGLGNKNFICSSSHGAGRVFSRREARKFLELNTISRELSSIKNNLSERNIDEAPRAYKNIFSVLELQKESIKIIGHIKPLINWKG